MVVEKSDVDISKLFHFGDKFTIKDKFGKKALDIYLRLVGDEDLNKARVFAIRKSAELRKELKNTNSDIYMAFIPDFSELTKEMLIEMQLGLSVGRFTREAVKEVDLPYPKEIDTEASLEEQEIYQREIDDYPIKRNKLIQDYLDKLINTERERLTTLSKETIEKEYENLLINELCEQEMLTRFREICVYFGTYRDREYTKRLFKSYEEFSNLLSYIKDQFINYYIGLEIGADELKK